MAGGPSLAMVALQTRGKRVAGGIGRAGRRRDWRRRCPGAALGCAHGALDADHTADLGPQVPGACKRGEADLSRVLRGSLARPVHTNQRPLNSPVLGARAGELPIRRRRGGDLCDIALLLDTHSCLCLQQ